jgi:hypothetical protein
MARNRVTTPPAESERQVDAYLRDLSSRLRGPRRRRERILVELRDGLGHAISDRTAAGLSDHEAVTTAIAQFGGPQAVADAFAGELATAYARRTIAAYIAIGPLVGIWWLLLLQPHPWRGGRLTLLVAMPAIPLIIVAIATAGGTFATTGRLMRWLPEASPQRALAATVAIAALALVCDLTVIAIYIGSDSLMRPLAALAVTASFARIACSLITTRHVTVMRRALAATNDAVPAAHGDCDARR